MFMLLKLNKTQDIICYYNEKPNEVCTTQHMK